MLEARMSLKDRLLSSLSTNCVETTVMGRFLVPENSVEVCSSFALVFRLPVESSAVYRRERDCERRIAAAVLRGGKALRLLSFPSAPPSAYTRTLYPPA